MPCHDPCLGLRTGQKRHPRQRPQAPPGGNGSSAECDCQSRQEPCRAQRKLSGDFGSIEPAQRGSHVRQQRCRHEIAERNADRTSNQGESSEFDHHQGNQPPEWRAHGAQGANRCAALLECKADGAMDDEQAYSK
jgi:hypothetical protein